MSKTTLLSFTVSRGFTTTSIANLGEVNELTTKERSVLIPDSIGNFTLSRNRIRAICERLFYNSLVDKFDNANNIYANKLSAYNENSDGKISLDDVHNAEKDIEKARIEKDLYLSDVLSGEIPDLSGYKPLEILFGFMIMGKGVAFVGGNDLVTKIAIYYNKYFDISENHDAQRVELKNAIMKFVNARLTDTTFKVDRITDEILRHIVASCVPNVKMSKKGVKSVVVPTGKEAIKKIESKVLTQVFINTVGVKTGYVKKSKSTAVSTTVTI